MTAKFASFPPLNSLFGAEHLNPLLPLPPPTSPPPITLRTDVVRRVTIVFTSLFCFPCPAGNAI